MPESFINILKILSAIVPGFLGIIGTVFTFREENRITKWGYVTIIGIALSSALTASVSIFDDRQKDAELVESKKKISALEKEALRNISKMDHLKISFFTTLPRNKFTDKYYSRFQDGIKNHRMHLIGIWDPKNVVDTDGISLSSSDGKGNYTFSIDQKSSLFPNKNDGVIRTVIETYCLSVFVKKEPLADPTTFNTIHGVSSPDSADFIGRCILESKNSLHYNEENSSFYIIGRQEISRDFWKRNGKIASHADLAGSQLFFLPPGIYNYPLPKEYKLVEKISDDLKQYEIDLPITSIFLSVTDGIEIHINGRNLQRGPYKDGFPIYWINLPSDGHYDSLAHDF